MKVGVEIGGTFTDLVRIDAGGLSIAKVPSTPSQPDVAKTDVTNPDVTRSLRMAYAAQQSPEDIAPPQITSPRARKGRITLSALVASTFQERDRGAIRIRQDPLASAALGSARLARLRGRRPHPLPRAR